MEATTGGPMVKLGTKWPSITSRWSMETPARSTRAISSASRAKSADRIDGIISIICGSTRFYHSGKNTISGVAPGDPVYGANDYTGGCGRDHLLVLFGFERTGGEIGRASCRERV